MSFELIFMCLVTGCLIGFEIGKYVAGKQIRDALSEFAEQMKKTSMVIKQRNEDIRKEIFDDGKGA